MASHPLCLYVLQLFCNLLLIRPVIQKPERNGGEFFRRVRKRPKQFFSSFFLCHSSSLSAAGHVSPFAFAVRPAVLFPLICSILVQSAAFVERKCKCFHSFRTMPVRRRKQRFSRRKKHGISSACPGIDCSNRHFTGIRFYVERFRPSHTMQDKTAP